jgi:hypothetical protein
MSTTLLDARCAVHPDRRAEGTCKRCGNYACAECNAIGFDSGVLCLQCAQSVGESRYHVVPLWRFVLFCVLTFGTYPVYWFWRNWSSIKRRDGSDIWPIPRAIFAGFTYFSLITDINTQLTLRGSSRRLSTGLGIGFLASSALYRLPDPYDMISVVAFGFLVPAVLAIRELASAAALEKAGWRARHTVALLVAVPFCAVALFGLLARP